VPETNQTDDDGDADDRLVYLRAQQTILEMIEGPEYSAGDRIPSERGLSVRLGISRMTVRRALTNLVSQGVLERRGTSGTYVTAPSVERPFDYDIAYSITEIVEGSGASPGSKLLYFESATANQKVADRLGVVTGAPLIIIRRLRTANGIPFCVETSYLPAQRVPGLVAADLLGDVSLYGILKSRYRIEIGGSEGLLGVAPVTVQEAELLSLKPDSLALVYRTVACDRDGRPIEYLTSVNHPRRVVFKSKNGAIVA
jgi:GntR family transcriptional regulator